MALITRRCGWVICKMVLEYFIPSIHSVDLVSINSLAITVAKVSFSPLSESSGDLSDTVFWVVLVVSFRCSENILE